MVGEVDGGERKNPLRSPRSRAGRSDRPDHERPATTSTSPCRDGSRPAPRSPISRRSGTLELPGSSPHARGTHDDEPQAAESYFFLARCSPRVQTRCRLTRSRPQPKPLAGPMPLVMESTRRLGSRTCKTPWKSQVATCTGRPDGFWNLWTW